jgi:hypothetical protein
MSRVNNIFACAPFMRDSNTPEIGSKADLPGARSETSLMTQLRRGAFLRALAADKTGARIFKRQRRSCWCNPASLGFG